LNKMEHWITRSWIVGTPLYSYLKLNGQIMTLFHHSSLMWNNQ